MFRTFLIPTKKLLIPRPLLALTCTQHEPASGPTTIYDVRRSSNVRDCHQPFLPLTNRIEAHPLLGQSALLTVQNLRSASGKKEFKMLDPTQIACNMINMLKCVDLNDIKDAPPQAFWIAISAGATQLAIPFLEIVGGYSPILTLLQLNLAAVTLGYLGGIKWGLALFDNSGPTPPWKTMGRSLLPPVIGITGLLLPYPLGFLTVSYGMVTSLYLDLKSCAYPPWACATALFTALTTVTGLMLALSAYVLFHNRENSKKRVKDKEVPQEENEEGGEDGDKEKK